MNNSPGDSRAESVPRLRSCPISPTIALLGAFVLEVGVLLGEASGVLSIGYFLDQERKPVIATLIVLPLVIYWLLESQWPIRISRVISEALIVVVFLLFGLIFIVAVFHEPSGGSTPWLALTTGIAVWLADLMVVVLIFVFLRRMNRSAWWACFWMFNIGILLQLTIPFWFPAALLLLASLLVYGTPMFRWTGVLMALATVANPFVIPVALTGAAGIWREKNRGHLSKNDAAFIVSSFLISLLAATLIIFLWPGARHDWIAYSKINIGYQLWPMIKLLGHFHHPIGLYLLFGMAWLTAVVALSLAALHLDWSVPQTAVHLCVLSLVFCPFYAYLLLLPVLALGALAWNRSAYWFTTIMMVLPSAYSRSYLAHHPIVIWGLWLLWISAVVLEVIQIIDDIRGSIRMAR